MLSKTEKQKLIAIGRACVEKEKVEYGFQDGETQREIAVLQNGALGESNYLDY